MSKRSPNKAVAETSGKASGSPPTPPKLAVEAVWADITKADAQVYAVGHYTGVPPQRAERALDQKVSRWEKKGDRLIISEFARRGVFRGSLGEVSFFPWDPGKLVAVVGMDRPGTFHQSQLRILARGLARSVGLLPDRANLATVLIGSGDGNLNVYDAATVLIEGFFEALLEDPTLHLDELKIVERDLDRALEIHKFLTELFGSKTFKSRFDGKLRYSLNKKLSDDPAGGGDVSPEFGCSLLLGAIAAIDGLADQTDIEKRVDRLLSRYPYPQLPAVIKKKFQQLKQQFEGNDLDEIEQVKRFAMALRLREREVDWVENVPSRVAFRVNGEDIHASAITNKVTVTERRIFDRLPLVEREIELLTDPRPDQFEKDGDSDLQRMLVPSDFREIIGKSESLVIDVDRKLARVQWEMLPSQPGAGPLGVTTKIARQLSTPYSPRPDDTRIGRGLSVLVIGDPDNKLPEAREEAKVVDELLRKRLGSGSVLTLIGPPEPGTRGGTEDGFGPADYSQVVKLLLRGRYDIIHYCGHADFDPANPERAGWIFDHGRLTASDLEGMERPPVLVLANACLTAQVSQTVASDEASGPAASATPRRSKRRYDAGLVASLADEFFRRGVTHYIGTAWEVLSLPAKDFAIEFYKRLLDKATVGRAVLEARKLLHTRAQAYGEDGRMAWAAYQHYGDPSGALEFEVVDVKRDITDIDSLQGEGVSGTCT